MNKFQSAIVTAWNFLDGKKTALGAGIMLASLVIPAIPGCAPLAPYAPVGMKIGAGLGGAGLYHKFIKWVPDAKVVADIALPVQERKVFDAVEVLTVGKGLQQVGEPQEAPMATITK